MAKSKTRMVDGWLTRDKRGGYQDYVLFWPGPRMRPDGTYNDDAGLPQAWGLSRWQQVYDLPAPRPGQGFPVSIEL